MGRTQPKSQLAQQIDENLKKVYKEEAERDMPDRFTKLLQQLKEQEANDGK